SRRSWKCTGWKLVGSYQLTTSLAMPIRRHNVIAMLLNMLSRLVRVRFTVTYAVTLVGVATALLLLGPQAQDQIIRRASTNLDNLRHGHLGTLLGSALVTDAGPMYLWLPGLVCLLALA